MLTAKPLPSPCVFSITVDAEFVHISCAPGRVQHLTGRHTVAAPGTLYAWTDANDAGEVTRTQLDGYVTDSARDALLWASELAQGGRDTPRRAIEVDHAVVVAALS